MTLVQIPNIAITKEILEPTALPSANETSAEKLATLLGGQALDRILLEEVAKFWHKLKQIAEGQQTAVQCP